MIVEIVTIGDELLLGETIDINAVWLARELGNVGISVVRRTTVGDGAGAISAAVLEALHRTGAVITTGGLGPRSPRCSDGRCDTTTRSGKGCALSGVSAEDPVSRPNPTGNRHSCRRELRY
jgi:hypothetical protein